INKRRPFGNYSEQAGKSPKCLVNALTGQVGSSQNEMPDDSNECCKELAGEAVKDAPRAFEFHEALLFFAKFPRMRHHGAARPASRMLHVQHLVKQDIFHRARRNLRAIHPAIQQNLMGSRIIATKLPPPAPCAPSNVRALQLPL